ncbi:hypothetical protein WPS_12760 [Vulcanimicrobium alpinum]|uniref:TonB C-terminal domain-containing protein n=2 Tax=Vulcanimicrobium alpinum TaxID=3016050 RepID=A0AAN2C8Z5_UNVUL|nr:hypothetical protein WPS_12760 [Vulcanimicrobium alpinum]
MTQLIKALAVGGGVILAAPSVASAATLTLIPNATQTVSATVRCSAAGAPASILAAADAELPGIAAGQNVQGATAIRIGLNPGGRLEYASVMRTSGNPWIDAAALRATRLSHYRSETRDCSSVSGEYAVLVDFSGEDK